LNLTVNYSTSSSTYDTICSSQVPYTWNGLIFNSIGYQAQTAHLTNASGCDSAATLHLVVRSPIVSPTIISAVTTIVVGQTGVVYTCSNVGPYSYQWSYSGTGATIMSNGDTTIVVDFASNATNGTMQVVAIGTGGCASTPASVAIILPTTLSNFVVTKVNKTALVKWTTATEINSKNFEVQRSIDGSNFATVGTIAAKGFASDYNFVDEKPFTGVNYYRLKQVDNDGKFALSTVKSVKFDTDNKFMVNIYPNPATDILNVRLTNGEAKQINILNTLGKIVYSTNVTTIGATQLPIKNLSAGTYFVEIVSNENRVVEKFIKN